MCVEYRMETLGKRHLLLNTAGSFADGNDPPLEVRQENYDI